MEISTKKVNKKWNLFTLKNDKGMEVEILDYGGIITKIMAPDKNGNLENIVLKYADYKTYERDSSFLGALIGPVAGRVRNSMLQINGETIHLESNENNHHLHSGKAGFNYCVWDVDTFNSMSCVGVKLTLRRKKGEGNYPGNLEATVIYSLTNENQLIMNCFAISDEDTPFTLTNHSYFNLSGDLNMAIDNHIVSLDSNSYLELDKELIPTGEVLDATNSPFDFRDGKALKHGIHSSLKQNSIANGGFDHYFILEHKKEEQIKVKDEKSGRVLSIATTQPGLVLYTGQNLEEDIELEGGTSKKYAGVCFETQNSPASLYINDLPSLILKANKPYSEKTVYTFSTE